MSAKPQSLFEMIQKATAADLEQLDKEIDAKEVVIIGIEAEVNRLKALRKTIDVIVNGKPERKKPEKKSKPGESAAQASYGSADERRAKVAQYLAKHGASKPSSIAADLGIPDGSITFVLSCGAFIKTPNGYVLTPEGRNKYLES